MQLKLIIKQIRVYQWVKNFLLFLPLIMAHRIEDYYSIISLFLGFISFSLAASAVYVINDIADIESDRKHPTKKNRPFASGKLPVSYGYILAPLFFIISLAIAILALNIQFILILISYIILTTLYSLILKKLYIVDIIVLSFLYTLRIMAGAYTVDIPISIWLTEFSIFFFLSIATVKRYAELNIIKDNNENQASRRGYSVQDLNIMHQIGITTGFLSVLVLTLYINSKSSEYLIGKVGDNLYTKPELLWIIAVFALFWIMRMWFLASRKQLIDDPVSFFLKDKLTYILGFISVIILFLATL
ncbi:MAG TPA: UbiA family prenyltransferase [Candidatus Kapabacteria bacterium]|nr:UbiA family prenyltransferase [Candidatus Kapabacteria bacterium]